MKRSSLLPAIVGLLAFFLLGTSVGQKPSSTSGTPEGLGLVVTVDSEGETGDATANNNSSATFERLGWRSPVKDRRAWLRRRLIDLLTTLQSRRWSQDRYHDDEDHHEGEGPPLHPSYAHHHVVHDPGFEGSYVAVSGRPGQRAVHIVNGVVRLPSGGDPITGVRSLPPFATPFPGRTDGPERPSSSRRDPGFYLKTDYTETAGYSALPRCSYINTDFFGDDVGDGKGISTGSAINCKQACQNLEACKFWTFREGWDRDCYLKRGRRGDPNPERAVPKIGFVSGTTGNSDCLCLTSSANTDEEICPLRSSRPIYPWKRKNDGPRESSPGNDDADRPFRFDYDDYDLDRGKGREVGGIDDGIASRRFQETVDPPETATTTPGGSTSSPRPRL